LNIKKRSQSFFYFLSIKSCILTELCYYKQDLSFFTFQMLNQAQLLQKYGDIIKEEVNVKEI